MNEQVFISDNKEETQKIAGEIAKGLKAGDVLALFGDLGAGKTTFVQGIAQGLGVESRIISPTFIILRTYPLKSKKFYHVDLYRIENEKEVEEIGLKEILKEKKDIVAIEWAEKIQNILPDERINVFLTNMGGDKRKITVWRR
jgi:tRNA threonylcarbamoyladenosine biosynthesis protein TsaE